MLTKTLLFKLKKNKISNKTKQQTQQKNNQKK